MLEQAIAHCVAKVVEIVDRGVDDRRSVLQLGYNLGRLSELTGAGRGPFWDRWKGPVAAWDLETLRTLAQQLQDLPISPTPSTIDPHRPPVSG